MILDTDAQKKIILALIDASNFTGKSLDEMYEFKQAVEKAEITDQETETEG